MATIGRGRAIAEIKNLKIGGILAWFLWIFVHIIYLIGFRNKLIVIIRYAWLFMTYSRGARLIIYNQES